MFYDDREEIPVNEFMGKTDPLARVLYGFSPDPGVSEFLDKFPVEAVTHILDRTPFPDDERFFKIRFPAMRF